MDRLSLAGAAAVVTGADSGIGKAVAVALARSGAHVRFVDHRAAALDDDGAAQLAHEIAPLDVLVLSSEPDESADLDALYRSEVRAPQCLLQHLLPKLIARSGQLVFVHTRNHVLHAFADSLRAELDPDDVRMLSVYVGQDGHRPPANDVAGAILNALTLPRTAEITEIRVRAMRAATTR